MKNYDIVIIGGGPGGYVAAIKARHFGAKVALIEKEYIGGVCLNIGCIPTKALLKSAKVYKTMMHSEDYGITVDKNAITFNWNKAVLRKDGIVKKLTGGVKTLLDKNGVDVYQGLGIVKDKNTIEVNGEVLKTNNLIIATGASPVIPPIPGVQEAYDNNIIITSKEALSLEELPKSIVIIGGGVIGVEFATLYNSLGANVTIIEMADRILTNVDDEVRNTYSRILKKDKIKILTSSTVTKVDNHNVTYSTNGKEETVTADKIFMCVGMRPNTKGFEQLGLEINRQGIVTNDRMETNISGIYAIGDVNGKMMLAHVASAEGIVAIENIYNKNSKIEYNKIPAGIYGSPEIAMVGLTEQQAKDLKLDYNSSKFSLAANGKALAEGETDGFIKILSDKKYGEVIGMHIIAPNATDMISEAVTTMELEGTIYELAKSVHPHPTLSEAIMEAAHVALGKPIHTLK